VTNDAAAIKNSEAPVGPNRPTEFGKGPSLHLSYQVCAVFSQGSSPEKG